MKQTYDTIVVGGGVVGTSAAYHLVRAGSKTLLIDRQDIGRATSAGAGILAPETSRYEDAWFHFAIAAVAYYSTLIPQLVEAGVGDTSYARCGLILTAATEDEIPDFEEVKALILARQQQRSQPSTADLHTITPSEARQLFPPLTDVHRALYYRNAARIDGEQLTQVMKSAAMQEGLAVLDASVEQLVIQGQRVVGVQVDGETLSAPKIIIAGGAWSKSFGKQLGVTLPVEPQRGQILHLDLVDTDTSSWPIINPLHGHYIVPWGQNRIVAGATRESGSGYKPHLTVAGVKETLDELMRVAPGLADARLGEIRVGLRPITPDGLPILGKIPSIDGLIVATGHGPTGLQLGPYSGKLTAEMAMGREPEISIDAFRADRF